jgi:CheY-like chemotaxis protein
MGYILVVEDDVSLREGLQEVFDIEGFEVFGVETGREALIKAKSEPPVLILCDYSLSDMEGYDVIRHVRRDPQTAAIPIIFMTAFTSVSHLQQALQCGANAYLLKPFYVEALFQMVRVYLTGP